MRYSPGSQFISEGGGRFQSVNACEISDCAVLTVTLFLWPVLEVRLCGMRQSEIDMSKTWVPQLIIGLELMVRASEID